MIENHPNELVGQIKIDASDTTKFGVYSTGVERKHTLGTRYRIGDNVYRYAKAGAALNPKFGGFNYSQFMQIDAGILGAVAIGDTKVRFTVDAGTTPIAVNELVGGYFSQPDTANAQFRRIIGQIGAGATGTVITLELDGPITRVMVTTSFMEICPNPYLDIRNNAGQMGSVMGMPTTVIASASYGWLKTWGPHWVNSGIAGLGSGINDRTVVFDSGGSIRQTSDFTWGETDAHQIAGFIMERTQAGDWTNPPFVFLQITP